MNRRPQTQTLHWHLKSKISVTPPVGRSSRSCYRFLQLFFVPNDSAASNFRHSKQSSDHTEHQLSNCTEAGKSDPFRPYNNIDSYEPKWQRCVHILRCVGIFASPYKQELMTTCMTELLRHGKTNVRKGGFTSRHKERSGQSNSLSTYARNKTTVQKRELKSQNTKKARLEYRGPGDGGEG